MLQEFDNKITSPVRQIKAKAELYNGSALVATYSYNDALKSITIERVGDNTKFFGFGVCQKLNIKLRDRERVINTGTHNSIKCYFSSNNEYVNNSPIFYVTENNRDENTNELSITAYDAIKNADKHTVIELEIVEDYTIKAFAEACANILGIAQVEIVGIDEENNPFYTYYPTGANFDGTETIREALNAIAEATQTIYYVMADKLVFKRLSNVTALEIGKDSYITLTSKDNRRLQTITHTTELGDAVSASIDALGTTQFIRDNPFYELREDIVSLLDAAIEAVGGLTINQFESNWRGNYLLEIGDKIELVTKDNNKVASYVLDDVIEYNGALSQKTKWSYSNSETETASNPTSLGETIKQTYARVDKAAKQIDIVASEASSNSDAIGALQINTESITASITKIEENTENAIEGVNEDIAILTNKVNAQLTADDVKLEIQKELQDGADKVVTTTGFTFDSDGLKINKNDSEMSTQITEDGMQVFKNNDAVLTANNVGVDAKNLRATTYLIIGTECRFERTVDNKIGCFWIGGTSN